MVPYCYLFLLTTCLGKSCSSGLPRVPFVNCCQFMYLGPSSLGLKGRIWDLIVSVPDHCLSFHFSKPCIFANYTSIFLHIAYVRNVSRTKTVVSVTSQTRLSPQAAASTFMRTNPNVMPLRQTGRRSDVIKQVRGIFQDLRDCMLGRTRFVLLTIVGWQYLVWHCL